MVRVTVWSEYRQEKENPEIAKVYPEGIHGAIAKYLRSQGGLEVRTATLDEPEHGLTDEVLNTTDVLTWWSHVAEAQEDLSYNSVKRKYPKLIHAAIYHLHS